MSSILTPPLISPVPASGPTRKTLTELPHELGDMNLRSTP